VSSGVTAGVILTHQRRLKIDPPGAKWPSNHTIRAAADVDSGDTCGNSCIAYSQSESIRAIVKKLGVSRNTVRRYLRDLSMVPTYPDRTQRATKLDSYKDYLLARIEAAKPHWIPATLLLREIQDIGYADGISQDN
jgi:hypothetical protein